MPRIEVRKTDDWAVGLEGPWRDSLENARFATPFHTLEWLTIWHRVYGGRPHVRLAWEGDNLVGAFAGVQTRAGVLRSMGYGPSDYLNPIVQKGSVDVENALFEGLRSPLLDLHQVRSTSVLETTIAANVHVWDQAKCLAIDLPDSFETYISGLSKSLRYDVRRINGKALTEKGARLVDATVEDIDARLDSFLDLHKQRWKSRGLPGAFIGRATKFQRLWVRAAVANGWLWLRTLEAEGRPAGAVLVMKFGTTAYFYQAGMDPSAKALSPGTTLVGDAIRTSIEEGFTTFDFLRGDEPYKRRWKPQRIESNVRILSAQGAYGARLLALQRQAFHVENKIRARFEGKSLLKRPSG